MKQPIDLMLDLVEWKPTANIHTDNVPYATHEGVLHLGEISMRIYQLSTGQRVIDSDDFERLFSSWQDLVK